MSTSLVLEPPPRPSSDTVDHALYVNRELSWLAFNERVLNEALNPSWPLLERVKFLAIYSANLDEFFMIRVSGLHEQLEAALIDTTPDGLSPREQLTRIGQIVRQQGEVAATLLTGDLLPALAGKQIHVRGWKDLTPDMQEAARGYFRRSVFPVLTPLAVDPGHPFPFLSNLSLSLAVEARDPDADERRFARVKVPESLPRFVPFSCFLPVPATTPSDTAAAAPSEPAHLLPLEQLIAANLDDLFPGMEILGCHPFRVTRDMDIEILEDEAHDLLATVDQEVRRRRFGACVRLEVDAQIPDRIRRILVEKLAIDEEDVYTSSTPLGLGALWSIANLPRPDLHDPPFAARQIEDLAETADPFAAIRRGDLLLHHPYDSFTGVLDFVRRAASDPQVLAIKMTLYRAGSNSQVVSALIEAAENGKQVAVSIELKARFDEANNIAWARALERAGAHVFFGNAALKTHAKVTLVVRHESDGLRRYVHLSTGNYNATTARVYTDVGLLTANPQIGDDVSELFNSLSGFSKKSRYRRLAVAPVGLAEAVLREIDGQIARAQTAGGQGYIFAKMNALVDLRIIQALYRASHAGVKIDLCIRGICCLRPGVPGVSENIRVFSVVGRFLEHERFFSFGRPGEERMFLSSADWMPRNLTRRVEVLFPVEAPALRERLRREVIEPVLADNSHAYDMGADGTYHRRSPPAGEPARGAQTEVLQRIGGLGMPEAQPHRLARTRAGSRRPKARPASQ
jgi:polyphosphate kinase